jgi:hypothetical protein
MSKYIELYRVEIGPLDGAPLVFPSIPPILQVSLLLDHFVALHEITLLEVLPLLEAHTALGTLADLHDILLLVLERFQRACLHVRRLPVKGAKDRTYHQTQLPSAVLA